MILTSIPFTASAASYVCELDGPDANGVSNAYCTYTETLSVSDIQDTYPVFGWSVHSEGISSFYYSFDGGAKQAMYSYLRDDISAVYPNYSCTVNAFAEDIDISSLTAGTHTLTVSGLTDAGSYYNVAVITITVTDTDINVLSGNAVIDKDAGTISGISANTTAEQLLSTLNHGVITNKENYILTTQRLASGYILNNVQNGITIEKYTIIVDGDVNGDAIINSKDVIMAKLISKNGASVGYKRAADIDNNGVVSVAEYSAIASSVTVQLPPTEEDAPTEILPDNSTTNTLNHRSTTVKAQEFSGTFTSVVSSADGLMLTDGASSGQFTSNDLDLNGSFTKMVATWNATSNLGTVEVCVQVKKSNGTYSDPFSWGVWSDKEDVSASASTSNSDGAVGIDLLELNQTCSGTIRFIVKLTRSDSGVSPVLRCVTFATNKSTGLLPGVDSCELKLDVPQRRQWEYVTASIGAKICSPASLYMILGYHGEPNLDLETIAWDVYDNASGLFGNWAFNMAHAGELGYNAFFDYYDPEALKYALNNGIPVACSVAIPTGSLTDSGYPDRQSYGHLMVVIGHTTIDGEDWFIINDPATTEVEIKLLAREFEAIWAQRNYGAYIVQKAD